MKYYVPCDREFLFAFFQRQIGFDRQGRAVLYLSFSQSCVDSCSVEESVHHITAVLENAGRSLKQDAHDFVWVTDFTGNNYSTFSDKGTSKLFLSYLVD